MHRILEEEKAVEAVLRLALTSYLFLLCVEWPLQAFLILVGMVLSARGASSLSYEQLDLGTDSSKAFNDTWCMVRSAQTTCDAKPKELDADPEHSSPRHCCWYLLYGKPPEEQRPTKTGRSTIISL